MSAIMRERITTYVTVIAGASAASALAVFAVAGFGTPGDAASATFFSLLVLLAYLLRYDGGRSGAAGSSASLPILAGIVCGPALVTPLFVGMAVLVAELAARRPTIRVVFNIAQYVLATSCAILVVRPFQPVIMQDPTAPDVVRAIAVSALCAFTFHGFNTTAVAKAISIDAKPSFREVWVRGAVRTIP